MNVFCMVCVCDGSQVSVWLETAVWSVCNPPPRVRIILTRSCSERVSNPGFCIQPLASVARAPLLRSGEWGLHTALTDIHPLHVQCVIMTVGWSVQWIMGNVVQYEATVCVVQESMGWKGNQICDTHHVHIVLTSYTVKLFIHISNIVYKRFNAAMIVLEYLELTFMRFSLGSNQLKWDI